MKKNKKKNLKILVILLLLLITTGCTTTLTDSNKKPVKNEETGQNLTKNIICQPTSKETREVYEKNNVKIEKLPKCSEFKLTSGKYEGLWTSFFIKPLAFVLLLLGKLVGNYAISLIIVSILIRLVAFPITKKTAMQSELMKKAQPEIDKVTKKYKDKQDQDAMMKQSQEMMMIYKKYNISPMSGCIFSLLQLPLFIAFFEAVQRTPALFEDKLLGLQLGTTPAVGITSATWYVYAILVIIIAVTTFYSLKMNLTASTAEPSMKMMPIMMSGIIIVTSLFMPSALGLYWITSNLLTIIQNILVKRSKEVNGKA